MIILKYGNLKKMQKIQRVKVKCLKCGCIMILEDGDYSTEDIGEKRYNPFKSMELETLKMRIRYKCAYCECENYRTIRKYNFATSFLIGIYDVVYMMILQDIC